ncbi:MAG: hypothetical protein QOF76_5171 [Solirubrobacteraceae bacterium]|nr:hypothetical protein [Solirubrobacteraceae bacterium]
MGLSGIPCALLACDADGRVVAVNQRCAELFGRDPTGEPVAALFPGETDVLDRLHDGPARLAAKRGNGTPFTVDAEAEAGDDALVVALIPLEGTRLLAETSVLMNIAFEQMPIGMALFNTDGEFMRVNNALSRMLARPESELIGRRDQLLTHPDDRAADLQGAELILSGALDTWTCEKRFLRPDGSVVWALANLFFLRDADGHPLCWFGQFADITASRRAATQTSSE